MSNRAHCTANPNDVPNRRRAARERQPAVVLVVVALLAGVAIICTALIGPILWTAVTEAALQPKLTYEQCGMMTEDASRLACFDRVSRQVSLHSVKSAHWPTFSDIFRTIEQSGAQ